MAAVIISKLILYYPGVHAGWDGVHQCALPLLRQLRLRRAGESSLRRVSL